LKVQVGKTIDDHGIFDCASIGSLYLSVDDHVQKPVTLPHLKSVNCYLVVKCR